MMTFRTRRFAALASGSLLILAACSQGSAPEGAAEGVKDAVKIATSTSSTQPTSQTSTESEFMFMEKFNTGMGDFVGLVRGESFAQSEPKINAVFTAYEGHADPLDISKKKSLVEAGWTQVLVTQDGLIDGTVAGQQLLAIYDQDDALITYGMRIKCHTASGVSDWQNTVC